MRQYGKEVHVGWPGKEVGKEAGCPGNGLVRPEKDAELISCVSPMAGSAGPLHVSPHPTTSHHTQPG